MKKVTRNEFIVMLKNLNVKWVNKVLDRMIEFDNQDLNYLANSGQIISLPTLVKELAVECFINETQETDATKMLRYQLKQLHTVGTFDFADNQRN